MNFYHFISGFNR